MATGSPRATQEGDARPRCGPAALSARSSSVLCFSVFTASSVISLVVTHTGATFHQSSAPVNRCRAMAERDDE